MAPPSEERRRSRRRSSDTFDRERRNNKTDGRARHNFYDDQPQRQSRRDERRRRESSFSDDSRDRHSHGRSRRREDESEERQVSKRQDDRERSPRGDRYRERRRDRDRHEHRVRSRSGHRRRRDSPPPKRRRGSDSISRSPPPRRAKHALPSQEESMRRANGDMLLDAPAEKQKPNYGASGLLAKEANTVSGTNTTLKYHEPPEARKPPSTEPWRMFIFKGKDLLDTVHLYERSCWLMGRDQAVTDLLLEHPSISKQHAVVQFRYIQKKTEYGDPMDTVRPYLIDLESTQGTKLNGKKIAESRYVELRDGDVLGFGDSTREYVMMRPPPETE